MNYYYVSYAGGGYGKLIATLLMFLVEKIDQPLKFDIPTTGEPCSCHFEWHKYEKFLNFNEIFNTRNFVDPWNYVKMSTDSPYKNIYFPYGPPSDFSTIINRYPNFKNIAITVKEEEKIFCVINHCLKAYSPGPFSNEQYSQLLPNFKEELKNLTEQQRKDITSLMSDNPIYYDQWITQYKKLPDNIKSHVTNINFFDIIENPTKVLNVLSWAAECPITSVVEDSYYFYIENQIEFYKKYVPWHPLFIFLPTALYAV